MTRPTSSAAAEAGSASVLAVGMVMMLCVCTLVVAVLGSLAVGQRRVSSAADLAALAAAGAVQRAQDGCAAAASVAASNEAELTDCRVDGEVVTVRVSREVPGAFGWRALLTVEARAGPGTAAGRAGPAAGRAAGTAGPAAGWGVRSPRAAG